MGNLPILLDMILRPLESVHSVMARLLSFLLISLRWGQYEVLDRVYILLVVAVSRMDAGHGGLVLKYMVSVNYVDQREASSVEADGDFSITKGRLFYNSPCIF